MAAALILAFMVAGSKPRPRTPRKPQPHYWKDAQGKVHMTDAPPPPGAEVLPGPSATAIEAEPARTPTAAPDPLAQLPPAARARWEAIRTRLQSARTRKDGAALSAQVHQVVQDARWGDGRRALLSLPLLGFAFLALIGWWLALGLHGPWRPTALGFFLCAGLALAQLLVVELVHRPQVARLREDLRILLQLGPAAPGSQANLDASFARLDEACGVGAAPWRFPLAVADLEDQATRILAAE
ncbi:MAG TPA: hypothetical protein VJ483_08640 [Holophagaceae bacterium]|nr:hypothetical protein [Holophagaceae bacterium]